MALQFKVLHNKCNLISLNVPEGIKLLEESGWTEENGEEMDEYEHFTPPAEVGSGQLLKEKFTSSVCATFPS